MGSTVTAQCLCATVLLAAMVMAMAAAQVPGEEMSALRDLHASTRGDAWRWRSEQQAGALWNFTMDAAGAFVHNPCSSNVSDNSGASVSTTWQGVSCSRPPGECSLLACHITSLLLGSYSLSGSIPPAIGNLSSLQELDFNNNQLTGPIPTAVGDLTGLTYISLSVNELTGQIPPEIGQLVNLHFLELEATPISGTLPQSLGTLSSLETLIIGETLVQGTIPIEIGKLTALTGLHLYSNRLTGTIPIELGYLTALDRLSFSSNWLTGTIPVEMGQLNNLKQLYFFRNRLTGSIPDAMWQVTNLQMFYLYSNQLTGTISIEVGNLSKLQQFIIYANHFTGAIPISLGQLLSLKHVVLRNNQFSGEMPGELGQLAELVTLSLHTNQLTGTIPDVWGQLTAMESLSLNLNIVTGAIPSVLGLLDNIDEIRMQDNLLSGCLPFELSKLRKLDILFLQNNLLTGSLEAVFNRTMQLKLSTLDISNNRLTGHFPDEFFLLPQLRVLSLSVNCFEEELPKTICAAEQVEVLSLNGLRAAEGCSGKVVVPFSGVALFNTIGGTIPMCVWSLRNLSVLHMTGNGLVGELINSLPAFSQLNDVSLSYNQLSGTISQQLLTIASLDLSHNQFGGEYEYRSQSKLESTLKLEINRLSGHLPASGLNIVSTGSLSVLRGNLFSCNSIPETDKYADDYVCGSRFLNYSMFMFVSAMGMVFMVVILVYWAQWSGPKHTRSRYLSILYETGFLLWTYATFLSVTPSGPVGERYGSKLRNVYGLCKSFVIVMRFAVQLLVIVLTGSAVLYLVKLFDSSDEYTTHSHTYAWFWTLAYMHGVVPASLLLLIWTVAISACVYRLYFRLHDKGCNLKSGILADHIPQSETSSGNKSSADLTATSFIAGDMSVVLAFLFNVCVTVTVNALYIISAQHDLGASIRFFLQLSLSIFRILYSAIALPLFSRSIPSAADNVHFRFLLLTINNLLIPCLVAALTSDACFQGLLESADAVSTPYSYRTCQYLTTSPNGQSVCTSYGSVYVESAPLIPPFLYNGQCGSVILTSYIPVFLLGYSFQLLLPFAMLAALSLLPNNLILRLLRIGLHGILWPDYWFEGGDEWDRKRALLDHNPDTMLRTRTIFCNDVLNNWLVMMTFGLCSPVLATAITLTVMLKMRFWSLLVGRFTNRIFLRDGIESGSVNFAAITTFPTNSLKSSTISCQNNEIIGVVLQSLVDTHIPLHDVLLGSFWLLAFCSALFVALLGWDLAANDLEWLRSIWVPLFPLMYVIILYMGLGWTRMQHNFDAHEDLLTQSVSPQQEMSNHCVPLSPLHVDSSGNI